VYFSNNTLLYFESISIHLQQIVKCKQLIFTNSNVIEIKTSGGVEPNDLANSPDDKKKHNYKLLPNSIAETNYLNGHEK
jgi:hypothetical protein